jgi:Ligand-gated ion channel
MVNILRSCSLLIIVSLPLSLAQESPSIFVNKFDYTRTFRTNVCKRQREIWNGQRTLPDALSGLNLTVAFTDDASSDKRFTLFGLLDGRIDELDPGLLVVILDEIARRAGFQWRNSFGTYNPIDIEVDGNKTWTDILLWTVETFDISNQIWGISTERISKGVSYPAPWHDSSIIFAEMLTNDQILETTNFWAFLMPFRVEVWIILCAAVFATGIVYFLIEKTFANVSSCDEYDPLSTCIYNTAMVITGIFDFKPRSHAARLLSFCWTLWVLVIISTYVANLASHLVTKNHTVRRIQSAEDAVMQRSTVCTQAGAVVESILNSTYPDIKIVRKENVESLFPSLRVDPSQGGCDVAALELNDAIMYERSSKLNSDCSISLSRGVAAVIPSGMATKVDSGSFRCTSLISAVLNYHILAMIDDGFVDESWKSHLNRYDEVKCQRQNSDSTAGVGNSADSIGMDEIGGIFVFHLAFSAIATLIASVKFLHMPSTWSEKIKRWFN